MKLNKLSKIAAKLDEKGLFSEADDITYVMIKLSGNESILQDWEHIKHAETARQRKQRQWNAAEELAHKWNLSTNHLFHWANDNNINLQDHLIEWMREDNWLRQYS